MTARHGGATREPERIWLEPECCADPAMGRTWAAQDEWTGRTECGMPATEYVRADLARAVLPSEMGALDKTEISATVHTALQSAVDLLPQNMPDDQAQTWVVASVIRALAPRLAAAQRAAFRAGVEAAAGVAEGTRDLQWEYAEQDRKLGDDEGAAASTHAGNTASGCAELIRALPTPAAFAAPEPDGWQPISTAPRDGEPFLAALSNEQVTILWAPSHASGPQARYLWWRGSAPVSVPIEDTHAPDSTFDLRATHWRPLPAPPGPDGERAP